MNRLYFYRSLITRIRQYLIGKSGTNPVTLTNAVEDKLLQGFSITGNSQQSGTPSVESPSPIQTTELKKSSNLLDNIGYSATLPTTVDGERTLTNNYGTTISTTETGEQVVVTQAKTEDPSYPSNYSNGYFCIVTNFKPVVGDIYTVYFEVDITDNPLNVTTFNIMYGGSLQAVAKKDVSGAYIGTTVIRAETTRPVLEIRPAGCSGTFKNFSVTKLENNLCDTVPFVSPSPNPDNGITFTNNGDGSITFNGTCTGHNLNIFCILIQQTFQQIKQNNIFVTLFIQALVEVVQHIMLNTNYI